MEYVTILCRHWDNWRITSQAVINLLLSVYNDTLNTVLKVSPGRHEIFRIHYHDDLNTAFICMTSPTHDVLITMMSYYIINKRHDIAPILIKLALNINQSISGGERHGKRDNVTIFCCSFCFLIKFLCFV
jgi:hypothetical protein